MASIISAGTTSGTSLNLSGDTSGVLELASNGSTTAVTIDTSQKATFAGVVQTATLNTPTGVLATQNGMTGIAKAWVNFNGTGTVAIRNSFNVSSITDDGTGLYTINFTTAMPNANYSPTINGGSGTGASAIGLLFTSAPSTTAFSVGMLNAAGSFVDREYVCVAVFSS